MPKTKKCPNCKEEKELSEFHANRARHDGLHQYCKPCTKALTRLTRKNWASDMIRQLDIDPSEY